MATSPPDGARAYVTDIGANTVSASWRGAAASGGRQRLHRAGGQGARSAAVRLRVASSGAVLHNSKRY
ncbi:MAG TPA: hypothetical protein VN888_22710, partial [Mycobacterium sp.]|nr:hypothetical protein [Mycobacterium sp.]